MGALTYATSNAAQHVFTSIERSITLEIFTLTKNRGPRTSIEGSGSQDGCSIGDALEPHRSGRHIVVGDRQGVR